jgi:hypothetical protein
MWYSYLFYLGVHKEELLVVNETDVITTFTADSMILLFCYFVFTVE